MRTKYPNSKAYAEDVFLKWLDSKTDVGILHTMAYARIDPPGTLVIPGQLNRRLANDTRYTLERDDDVLTGNEDSSSSTGNFLHPRDLSERVLTKDVDLNMLVHLEGKKSISAYESKIKKQRTKAPTNENIKDRGGYPSAYVISEDVMRIRTISEKTGAANYIRERMNEYGLGYDLTKYLIEAVFHAAKKDKRILPFIIGTGARFMNNNLTESEIHNMEPISQRLQLISDSDLQRFAENLTKFLTENQGYHELLIFLSTFIKLWNKP
ncbi:MAG: hypothetical protein WA364_24125 [Candidatus Nitrosopolaris sp.]